MSSRTSLTILSINKITKPRAARTSATMEKTQIELLLVLYVKTFSLKYKKQTESSPFCSLLNSLYPLPKSAVAITRKIMPKTFITTAIICKSRLV